LVCEPNLLLLDEFTNNLDIRHKLRFFYLIRDLASKRGITTVLALHDINFAARFADSVLVLNGGAVKAFGPPREVITGELLRSVYSIEARVEHGANGDTPFIVPLTPLFEGSET